MNLFSRTEESRAMKKTVYIAVAALAFSLGCTEEAKYDAVPDATAEGFSIKADIAATKTVFDGATKVEWEDGDALGVYIDGGETHGLYRFEKSAGGGNMFSCAEFTPEDGVEYTYYILYPYNDFSVADGKSGTVVSFGGYQNVTVADASYVDTPLYCMTSGTGSEEPEVLMHHLATVVKVNVRNATGAPVQVSEVRLAPAGNICLEGDFSLDFNSGALTPAEDNAEYSAVLPLSVTVEDEATFYLASAPFTAEDGLEVSVTAGGETYPVKKDGPLTFAAGHIRATTVTLGGAWTEPETIESVSISGTAAGPEPIQVARTLENENLYAWKGELNEGSLVISVNDGAGYISVADRNFTGVESGYTVLEDAAEWDVQADTYRIVIDTEKRTVAVRNSDNDLENTVVEYNNTVDKVNPFSQSVTELWMWGGFNSFSTGEGMKTGFDPEYKLTQSLANPQLFVYHGDVLPCLNAVDANNGNQRKTGFIKFLVSNIENNVYAYGSTAAAKRNEYSGYLEDIVHGQPYTLVPGQSDNRYAYFILPENTNYVEINIEELTVIFDNR